MFLVGTSLIVIIPEGVETLYSSQTAHAHTRQLVIRSMAVEWSHGHAAPAFTNLDMRTESLDNLGALGPVIPSTNDFPPPKTPTEDGVVGILEDNGKTSSQDQTKDDHEEAHHAWIGVALIAGFILMFLIDKLPQYTTSSKPQSHTRHISLTSLGRRFNLTTLDRQQEEDTFLDTAQPSAEPTDRSSATTIGLVIHAAADGIALGASSSTSNTGLSFVIFFAIMVHKAPAAFGLTSVLLKQGLSKRMARAHLIIFSLAAPAGAFLTYLLVNTLGGGSATNTPQNSQWWTGMLLLFSAGTFLYVAMHSMQEVTTPTRKESFGNGATNGSIHEGREAAIQEDKPSITDIGAAVFGMILPLFLQVGHAH
ncbi:hypothetical protein LTS08_003206 [Lithohypha guttulata]|nr:hypothetical protein LTS08_003206 [Lithohypha guttulata]